jgi:sporulation protein YlmC with PRC-barrel domain
MICSSDLQGRPVRSESGERFGRVFEIKAKQGQVEALICGGGGFWQRLASARTGGHHIPWSRVRSVGKEVVIAD